MATWEASMLALFDDLEQQATGLSLLERDLEVADRSQAEYASVALAGRLHASVGRELTVRLAGGRVTSGRSVRTGPDWLMLAVSGSEWVVRTAAVISVSGLTARADSEETWSVVDRLSVRAVLRRLASEAAECVVHATDGQQVEGRVGRVGQDFLELHVGREGLHVVPLASMAALQRRASR